MTTAVSTQGRLPRIALALALGAIGGAIANWLQLPLAWMIGAMMATTIASIARAPVQMSVPLRSVMVAVLGVMLGSGFTPDIIQHLAKWALSLSLLVAYAAIGGGACYYFYRRVYRYDRVTAYFAGMPGGLSEMILVGGALGGDARIISLVHASRILLVVMTLPFAFTLLLDYQPGDKPPFGLPILEIPLADLAILAGCAVAGFLLARAVKLPAAALVGPMILSAAAHLTGLTVAKPPLELVLLAQIVVGSAVGCRFAGVGAWLVFRALGAAVGGTAILILTTVLFAGLLHWVTDLSLPSLVLSFSPGGLAEMTLIAVAIGLEPAFVATHHTVRIFLIVVLAPSTFKALFRGRSEKSSDAG